VSRRHVWFKLTVPLLALALVVLAIEVALRVAGYNPLQKATEGTGFFLAASADPDLAYVLVPDTRGRAWGADISINSLGFRDRDYDHKKPDGAYRILVIGDSITFGNRMLVADTYPEQLEAMCVEADRRVEVLNMGVGGYDPLNEVALLERRGQDLAPDRVVVGYCINDAGVQSANLSIIRFLEQQPALVRASRLVQLVSVRIDRTAQARDFQESNREDVFERRYEDRIRPLDDDPEIRELIAAVDRYIEAHPPGPRLPYASWYASTARVGRIRYAFERLRDLAAQGAYEVTVLIIPLLDEEGHAPLYDGVYAIVEHEARRVGFDVVSARPTFQAAGMQNLALLRGRHPDPLHPNAAAHEMLARLLYDHLFAKDARDNRTR